MTACRCEWHAHPDSQPSGPPCRRAMRELLRVAKPAATSRWELDRARAKRQRDAGASA